MRTARCVMRTRHSLSQRNGRRVINAVSGWRHHKGPGGAAEAARRIAQSPGGLKPARAVDPSRGVRPRCVPVTAPDAIWITEVWDSPELHRASLALPSVQAAIAKARPMITGFGERFETEPVAPE